MDIRVRVPRTPGHTPSLSLLPRASESEHEIDIELGDVTLTLYGRTDDLFAVFLTGKEMLESFLFGNESRLSEGTGQAEKPAPIMTPEYARAWTRQYLKNVREVG